MSASTAKSFSSVSMVVKKPPSPVAVPGAPEVGEPRQAIGWVNSLLSKPGDHEALANLKSEAEAAQAHLVKVVEAAMLAWQEALHTVNQLEAARAEHISASAKAKEKSAAAKKFVETKELAEQAAEEAKEEVTRAIEAVESATMGATNAVELAEAAKQAADDAQEEVFKTTEEYDRAQSNVKEQEEATKGARKALDRATINVDETKKQISVATSNITKAETNAASKAEKASDASKKAYEACAQRDEAEERLDSATRAADDLEGVWLDRHLKKVKQLEAEFKKAANNAAKLQREEELAEIASTDATAVVSKSHSDLALRKTEADEAIIATSSAGEKLSIANQAYEQALKEEKESRAKLETSTKNLKAAQAKAKKTTVARAEEALDTAKQTLVESTQREKDKSRQAARAKDLMLQPVQEAEAANAVAKEKAEAAEAAELPERDAIAKEEFVADAITEFETKVKAMAMEVYRARHDTEAFWGEEENEEKAEIAKQARLAVALRDVHGLSLAKDRVKNQQVSPSEKWIIFKQAVDTSIAHHKGLLDPTEKLPFDVHRGVDSWAVHRLLFEPDGEIVASITMVVSGIIGLALDRGPPHADKCKVDGNGLSQASVNQTASFDITSCSDQGIQFDDGGDQFRVVIRYSGLGRQNIRTKITDNDDGTYTCTFKPSCAGKCSIQVMLLARDGSKAEELPGSPFTCTVSSFSGPRPVPSECEVSGDALTKATAQTPQQFYINFRDALGQLTHACDLDVWVQPIGKHEIPLPPPPPKEGDAAAEGVPATPPPRSPAHLMIPRPVQMSGEDAPPLPNDVAQLLAQGPPGALETLVVGPRALEVSSSPDLDSRRVARHACRIFRNQSTDVAATPDSQLSLPSARVSCSRQVAAGPPPEARQVGAAYPGGWHSAHACEAGAGGP